MARSLGIGQGPCTLAVRCVAVALRVAVAAAADCWMRLAIAFRCRMVLVVCFFLYVWCLWRCVVFMVLSVRVSGVGVHGIVVFFLLVVFMEFSMVFLALVFKEFFMA